MKYEEKMAPPTHSPEFPVSLDRLHEFEIEILVKWAKSHDPCSCGDFFAALCKDMRESIAAHWQERIDNAHDAMAEIEEDFHKRMGLGSFAGDAGEGGNQ